MSFDNIRKKKKLGYRFGKKMSSVWGIRALGVGSKHVVGLWLLLARRGGETWQRSSRASGVEHAHLASTLPVEQLITLACGLP